jgi:phenylalanyl-tRNA synthetase beta chain
MMSRLQAAGVRPISPVVDITNYVLMELGHPMHAFDLDALGGHQLRIRRAQGGETLTTIDGVERKLDVEMLVIADRDRPQAVAGVMGGAPSEVSRSTRRVAFESAYFKPASVRRTSKKLGLLTEASFRFERGADINVPVVALKRAAALLEQVGAGRVGSLIDRYPRPQGPRSLTLRRERLDRVLGLTIPERDVTRILQSLGLSVSVTGSGWNVSVPTFRVDLLREIDLIEDVGRHYGFDKLEPAFPVLDTAGVPSDPRVARDRLLRSVLTAGGLSEAVTFGFIESSAARPFAPSEDSSSQLVSIGNPLSAKFDTLRPSLLPGLLEAVAHNRRHGRRDVALFEIGSRFSSVCGETRGAALAWTGTAVREHWSGGAREVDFFDIKGVVELACAALAGPARVAPSAQPFLVPGQAAEIFVADKSVGVVGRLVDSIVERAGAPPQDAVYVAELSLDALATLHRDADVWVRPLPRHPFVVRDLSVIVGDALPAEIIRGTIQAAGAQAAAPLAGIAFFDRYSGTGVPAGSVSVSVRLTFQASDRTLTDGEVQEAFDKILAALVREHGARQR